MPINSFAPSRQLHPQITLYFEEDLSRQPNKVRPGLGEISFRLMNETAETITENECRRLAKET